MITIKDIENRVYKDKICVGFDYCLVLENSEELNFRFRRNLENALEWKMQVVVDRTRERSSIVYDFSYLLPKKSIPLEMVAAIGLRFFQLTVKEEVQKNSEIDFELGERLVGMLHE